MTSLLRAHRLSVGVWGLLLAGAASAATPLYRAQPIEPVPGTDSCVASSINASGQTTGDSYSRSAGTYTGWVARRSGRLSGSQPLARSWSVVIGLDDEARLLANRPGTDPYGDDDRAYLTGPKGLGRMPIDRLGHPYSQASAISADGRVTGWLRTASGESHAFVTGPAGAGTIDLHAAMAGGFDAWAVNTRGQVVGVRSGYYVVASGSEAHGFVDLPVPGGGPFSNDAPRAVGINASGLIAGWTHEELGDFISGWLIRADGTGLRQFAPLPGAGDNVIEPAALNDAGTIVGRASSARRGHWTAAVIARGPTAPLQDLNDLVEPGPHGYLEAARDINEAGQIVADSDNGLCYRLDPIPAAAARP